MHTRIMLAGGISLLVLLCIGGLSKAHGGDNPPQGCLRCHNGIESIGKSHDRLDCVFCHKGNPDASSAESAHRGVFRNPGDFRIVENSCGMCHSKIVSKMVKSLHATSAGIISGARYLWAAQEEKNALYAVRQVEDRDGDVPGEYGAVKALKQIPRYEDSMRPVDDYPEGARRRGDYRSSGCSACHVLYADDGLSRSGDPTTPEDIPGHPIRHEITVKIPAEECVHCHNRGGRTGVSFLGMMESDGYGTPFRTDGTEQPKLHGKHYNFLQRDIHYDRGMACIDCHTENDVHGDGNIYSKREQAVEIECSDCHGTINEFSQLKTSRGNPLNNLQRQSEEVVLRGKIDGKLRKVPQIRSLAQRDALPVAMQIEGHIEKLECYACHARWAPQCYGCHAKMDKREQGNDWVDGTKDSTYKWQESRSYLRWETPVLGINTEGKVSPFITACQVIFSLIGKDGKAEESNKVYVTADGHYGIAHNPIQPHTVTRQARTCENCHSETKALGLGSGHYMSVFNQVDIPFELERIVDEDGVQIQATSHVGARPFNKAEMDRIKRINVCIGCHQEMPTLFWKNVRKVWGEAKTNELHRDILHELLRGGTRKSE
jgi:formate-dependent nitrite reductase cytochrome c552 subunit